ncbi:CPBP family intramembrane glutamic endopeptidase [Leptolinea tardivitalis]|uniref:CPBP family intramembrane glutamic endopeptidase n=1 Tax=Leptolinea tardivitalis TaxID=229920 RepID=UPI000781DF5A|nr:CPBP family intramembrane glutamic endopeptidase [Leptolinea tardivitalis]GAP22619.1 CAAX protease self-immunity [Leptolinea tardivitalis]
MKSIKLFMNRFPLIFCLVVMSIATALTELPLEGLFTPALGLQKASYLSGALQQGIVSLLLFVFIAQLGLLTEGGFTRPSKWKAVWLIWPLLIYSVLNGSEMIGGPLKSNLTDGSLIALYVLLYISVGTIEEFLFRGLLLPVMLRKWGSTRKGIFLAVIISSAVFGLVHIINLLAGRRDLLTTGTQILYGTFFGVFFAALMLRTNSIWPAVFGHFLFDLCGNLTELSVGWVFTRKEPTTTVNGALITLAVLLPLLLIGLFYLRKVEPKTGGEEKPVLSAGVPEVV